HSMLVSAAISKSATAQNYSPTTISISANIQPHIPVNSGLSAIFNAKSANVTRMSNANNTKNIRVTFASFALKFSPYRLRYIFSAASKPLRMQFGIPIP
ncbi:MAG: hypothetical protein LBJ00_00660, partial [Planctomycetaceae bacterium]|nr:hypothetical protein [Planctomycetaceae bacterium]